MKVKFYIFSLFLFFLIFELNFPGKAFLAQAQDYQKNIDKQTGIDLNLERELRESGIDPEAFSGEMYDFVDGDFELSKKIRAAIREGSLFKNNPELRKSLNSLVDNDPSVLFSPWILDPSAALTSEDNNFYLKLSLAGPSSSSSATQHIKFNNKNARIEFDLYPISVSRGSIMEVTASALEQYDSSDGPEEIVLASFTLQQGSGFESFSIDLSKNPEFKELFNKFPDSIYSVTFSLLSDSGKTAAVGLDKIAVAY
ncbi:MAG: hypothetical protein JW867_02940 [Candidatus Omnitrophica bacterium]|nr:hypothetical protein [Candidatus Omnitrophota bacterium]